MTPSSGPTAVTEPAISPPPSCDLLLEAVEPQRRSVFDLVRRILDDLEGAAPWDDLYYPPPVIEDFMRMETLLLGVISGIPGRVEKLVGEIEETELDEPLEIFLGDLEFFFRGIHASVEPELEKLVQQVELLREEGSSLELSEEDRNFVAELSADLKGKYASSMMGAASALIAEGRWNGVEIEPVLFPEKRGEFERNRRLVETLSEVNENIANLLDQVPLANLAASWSEEQRVDQYALTPLYSLLGNLGKLMQETSRRALYSGDYHQIQRREGLLSTRVNELATLHNITWGNVPSYGLSSPNAAYPEMIRKARELAAILDLDLLRRIVGDKDVNTILDVVTLEKEANPAAGRWRGRTDAAAVEPHRARRLVPQELHSLIPLLYDEDLRTFLELLLGSILKRASLSVREPAEAPPEASVEPAEIAAVAEPAAVEPLPAPVQPTPAPAQPPPAGVEPSSTEGFPGDPFPAAEPTPAEPVAVGVGDGGGIADGDTPPATDVLPPAIPDELLGPDAIAWIDPEDAPRLPVAEEEVVHPEPEPFPPPDTGSFPSVDSDGPRAEPAPGLLGPSFDAPQELDLPSTDFDETFGGGLELETRGDDGASREIQLVALDELQGLLVGLLSRSNSHRKSFELVHRLLKQRRNVPPAMIQTMQPYLFDLMNELIPKLHQDLGDPELFGAYASQLFENCQALCRPNPTPQQILSVMPGAMQQVLDVLNGLSSAVQTSIDRLFGMT
ncbi:MAG: hypothetical protein AAGD06_11730 [Acidobacteriota bacterium]